MLAAVKAKPRQSAAAIRPAFTSAARDGLARSVGTEERPRLIEQGSTSTTVGGNHAQRSFTVQTGMARPITDESGDGPK